MAVEWFTEPIVNAGFLTAAIYILEKSFIYMSYEIVGGGCHYEENENGPQLNPVFPAEQVHNRVAVGRVWN